MTKLDPMIAVKDVGASAKWYEQIFDFRNSSPEGHGFAVLKSKADEIVLCLHQWETDDHPTMTNPNLTTGNGLLFYFRTTDWMGVNHNLEKIGWAIEEGIHPNTNSGKQEFSFRDPDGYFITVTEFHIYEG